MRMLGALAAAAATASAAPGWAQEAAVPEINIRESGNAGSRDMLRRATPAPGFEGWWTPADFPAGIAPTGQQIAIVDVAVTADDRTTGCIVRYESQGPQLGETACRLMRERGRFRHALAFDGTPRDGIVTMWVDYRLRLPSSPPYSPPPSPPPPPARWPVTMQHDWLVTERAPDWRRFGRPGAKGEVAVQILFRERDGKLDCSVLKGSGDARLDAATCAAARSGGYALAPGSRLPFGFLPMIVRWSGREATVALPSVEARRARPANDSALALAGVAPGGVTNASPTVALAIGADGAVTQCRVILSAGSDAADLATCAALRAAMRFVPAADVFGLAYASEWWGKVAIAR